MRTVRAFVVFAAALTFSVVLKAQPLATGQLLVATAVQTDPNFSSTVLLLVHHGDDGSIGIFLNRPTWIEPGEAFSDIEALDNYTGSLFLGGPVAPTQLLVLLRSDEVPAYDVAPVVDDVYITPNLDILADESLMGTGETNVRLYAGQAGWGPRQLEAEISAGQWLVRDGDAELLFTAEPSELWQQLITPGSESDLVFVPRRTNQTQPEAVSGIESVRVADVFLQTTLQ